MDKYLTRDEEGDYVVITKPCPFLGSDNFCGIYEVRPSDCRRFPYTDEDVFLKKIKITLKNSTFCPAVYLILEKMNNWPKLLLKKIRNIGRFALSVSQKTPSSQRGSEATNVAYFTQVATWVTYYIIN